MIPVSQQREVRKMLAGTGPTPQMKDTEQFQFLPKGKDVITAFTAMSIPGFTALSHRYVLKEHPAGEKKITTTKKTSQSARHGRHAIVGRLRHF